MCVHALHRHSRHIWHIYADRVKTVGVGARVLQHRSSMLQHVCVGGAGVTTDVRSVVDVLYVGGLGYAYRLALRCSVSVAMS